MRVDGGWAARNRAPVKRTAPPTPVPRPRVLSRDAYRDHARALYARTLARVVETGEEPDDGWPTRLLVTSRCAEVLHPDAVAAASHTGTPKPVTVSDLRAAVAAAWISEAPA